MNGTVIKELKALLEPLAEKMGEAGVKLYELALRQNYVFIIQDAIYLVFTLLLSVAYYKLFRYGAALAVSEYKRDSRRWSEEEWLVGALVIGGMVLVIMLGIALGTVLSMTGRLINPEWHAIQDLIKMVRPS